MGRAHVAARLTIKFDFSWHRGYRACTRTVKTVCTRGIVENYRRLAEYVNGPPSAISSFFADDRCDTDSIQISSPFTVSFERGRRFSIKKCYFVL